jgi:hypothetical protein
MMAWQSSEPHICRRVSSLRHAWCSLSDISQARCYLTSSFSRRAILYARPSASS